jgi:2-desacetyl-2-hydroxyethyl bacteriochlorophyllide A dehydrogenase
MRAVIYEGTGRVSSREVPIPSPDHGEALIKVAFAGICGTDLNILSGKHPRAKAPLVLGHEFSGTIVELRGEDHGNLKVGQRVAVMPYLSCGLCRPCRDGYPHVCSSLRVVGVDRDGGFAEYVIVPYEKVFPLKDNIPLRRGALVEPLAVGVHILNRTQPQLGDVAVVLGCGPIGLLVSFLLRKSGIQRVYLSEVNKFRISRARALGFEVVHGAEADLVDFVLERTDGNGADVVFEVAGVTDTIGKVVQLTRPHGKVMLVGAHKEPPRIDVRHAVFKELTFLTSRVSTDRDFQTATDMMAEDETTELEELITHEFSLAEGEAAFEIAGNPHEHQFKILFKAN